MTDAASAIFAELTAIRDKAFVELMDGADLAASHARSLAEAAFRGDDKGVGECLRELRSCVVAMIKTYKEVLEGKANGQGVSAGVGSQPHREDQRSGDGVARG